jgi:hypothetical protein
LAAAHDKTHFIARLLIHDPRTVVFMVLPQFVVEQGRIGGAGELGIVNRRDAVLSTR